jgi:quercetin dioxygenase-like cupin family protein
MEDAQVDYPAIVTGLPEADIPLPGVRGWLLQGAGKQLVFFDIAQGAQVPPHSHGAQWGVMVDGEMSLTIGGETRRCRRGDSYFIPAGVPHAAVFHTRVRAIDFFDEPARYRPK